MIRTSMTRTRCWHLGFAVLLAVAAGAQTADQLAHVEGIRPSTYVAYRAPEPLTIDGRLDEGAWTKAPWTELFVDIEGAVRPTPRFRTRAKMLWDERCFYVAAELEEPHVWATLTQRDTVIFYDNDFEVFIDPDADTHQYYEFEMNALSTEWDLFLVKPYRNGGPAMNAWQILGLRTATGVQGTLNDPADEDQGWTAELAFPWAVLRECAGGKAAPPKDGDQWRVNFSRVEWQTRVEDGRYLKVPGTREDNWVWSPQGLVNMHMPEQWGIVQFSTIEAGAGIAAWVPDPGDEARRALRRVYYRQVLFHEAQGRYTASLDSLRIPDPGLEGYTWPPRIQVTDHAYEASIAELTDHDADGRLNRWLICQDSRVWKD